MSDAIYSPEFRELFRVIAERSPSEEDEIFGRDDQSRYNVYRKEPSAFRFKLDDGDKEYEIIATTEIGTEDSVDGLKSEFYYLSLGGEAVRQVAGTNKTSLLDNRQIAQTTEKIRSI